MKLTMAGVFVTDKLLKPNLEGSTFQGLHPGRLQTYTQILDYAAGDKHSSLLQIFLNCDHKKFYTIRPRGLFHETFSDCNDFVVS